LHLADGTLLSKSLNIMVLNNHIGRKAVGHRDDIGVIEADLVRPGLQLAIPVRSVAAGLPVVGRLIAAVLFKAVLAAVPEMPLADDGGVVAL